MPGNEPVRTPAPTGSGYRIWFVKTLGHQTWFVKTDVGAHTVRPPFPGAAGVDRAGAQYPQGVRRIRKAAKLPTAALCAPLHTVYRSIPIDGGRRAEIVAPYGDLYSNSIAGKYGGLCRTTDSEATFKPRGQVVAREAERQRMFIA